MTEQEEFLKSKSEVSLQTQKNYRLQYIKWRQALNKDLQNATQEELLSVVKGFTNNPTSEWTYLNLPIMVLRQFNKPIDLLEDRRTELKKERECHTEIYKKEKAKQLPSKKIITDYTKKLFEDKLYFKFIINYLLITYGVRNKDIDIFITDSTNKGLTDRNLMIIRKSEAEWIINDYKTKGKHGIKNIIIKSKPFLEAIKSLPINTWLFTATGTSNHIMNTSLSRIISRNTYNELTEADYFKVLIRDANKSSNTMKLMKLYSDTRGTDIETILAFYDTSEDCEIPDDI